MTIEGAPVRRRPPNRRQLVVDAAGPVFSEHGYHGASMEEVAAKVGMSAAALYRHFPNKYALFVECANLMADRLQSVLGELPDQVTLPEAFRAIAQVTVEHRASGGVYRWEARFLEVEERRELRAKFAFVVDSVTSVLDRDLGGTRTHLRASAALGAIGSITLHHTPIARQRAVALLADAALGAASVDPTTVPRTASAVHRLILPEPVSRRAEILQAAIPLFAQHGFHNVSMGQVAGAIGLSASAIYRHYPAKADILAAACLQAAAMLEQTVGRALDGMREPQECLEALAAAYVAFSFANTALLRVAGAEIVGLPPDLQRPVTLAQREHVALWERHLAQARPELDARQVRTLVHAGFGVVVEAGRALRWQDTDESMDAVTALMLGALGV